MASQEENPAQTQNVRFSSQNEVIEPNENSLQQVETQSRAKERDDLSPEAREELQNLSSTLRQSRLQTKRLENFAYEPVSLPPSRAPSPSHQTPMHSGAPSPRGSPMSSPPLTPAASGSREAKASVSSLSKVQPDPDIMTPQESPHHEPPPTSMPMGPVAQSLAMGEAQAQAQLQGLPRPKSMTDVPIPAYPKPGPNLTVGPGSDSRPSSQDTSPSGTPGPSTPVGGSPYSKPFNASDNLDPYARSRRAPTSRDGPIDPRFIFNGRNDNRKSSSNIPRSSGSGADLKNLDNKSRHSFFGGSTKQESTNESAMSGTLNKQKQHGSMSELKRFLKLGGHKKEKRTASPSNSTRNSKSGTQTPPSRPGSMALPFADDHGLQSKYGKFGKVLGSGAGGSVRLMKRSSDGTTFAVKQFRARHTYETEKEYNKKVTAEYCIGSTLHHGNIIETMDIIHEKGNWYEVMEYAPFDLFACVMTGKMSREEVSCTTLQVLSGVAYLHGMGLAHRDLKLDNVVVNEHGIMKIIDFGSAVVFRYPFETEVVLASGIVGSDPYLAPEVYDVSKYDPRPTDVWSLAIMFCCMTLRRFPWKAPRLSDNSYKLFVAEPEGEDARRLSGLMQQPKSEPASGASTNDSHHHRHHHHGRSSHEAQSDPSSRQTDGGASSTGDETRQPEKVQSQVPYPPKQEVIKGPWRLLRLLPRETRHIVGRMLEVDPKRRATLEEIMADRWVIESPVCRQEEGGRVVHAGNHQHTLEPGSGPTPTSSKK
ncbi:Pkinase-domain-containing protein [Aulographum hederae CBS 113979]|uniref:non-specific serine/threonine protein kinase n=1 Tax=Aulographum hederae CBS 113979 TaxID=1176131 RepID=A0A6G1HCG0_9PEZI|nr:Pkinase-domain-containing protein [Aulographum hederae CBS 113979]